MKKAKTKKQQESFQNGMPYEGMFQIVLAKGESVSAGILTREGVSLSRGVLTIVSGRIKKLNSVFEIFTNTRKNSKAFNLGFEKVSEIRYCRPKKLWKHR